MFDDFDAFGATIELSKDIVATSRFDQVNILPLQPAREESVNLQIS